MRKKNCSLTHEHMCRNPKHISRINPALYEKDNCWANKDKWLEHTRIQRHPNLSEPCLLRKTHGVTSCVPIAHHYWGNSKGSSKVRHCTVGGGAVRGLAGKIPALLA